MARCVGFSQTGVIREKMKRSISNYQLRFIADDFASAGKSDSSVTCRKKRTGRKKCGVDQVKKVVSKFKKDKENNSPIPRNVVQGKSDVSSSESKRRGRKRKKGSERVAKKFAGDTGNVLPIPRNAGQGLESNRYSKDNFNTLFKEYPGATVYRDMEDSEDEVSRIYYFSTGGRMYKSSGAFLPAFDVGPAYDTADREEEESRAGYFSTGSQLYRSSGRFQRAVHFGSLYDLQEFVEECSNLEAVKSIRSHPDEEFSAPNNCSDPSLLLNISSDASRNQLTTTPFEQMQLHNIERVKTEDKNECASEESAGEQRESEGKSDYKDVGNEERNAREKNGSQSRGSSSPNTNLKCNEGKVAEKKSFTCEVCDKCFRRSYDLKVHRRVHTGEKPYKCTNCSKSFIQNSHLVEHSVTHSDEQPFRCSVCDKAFKLRSNLNAHSKLHSGEKPFQCAECKKVFAQKKQLILHIRTHTGEKPYKCSLCGKAFGHSGNLTKHMHIHSGQRPFKCSICEKGFHQKSSVTRHMRRHNG